jgi:hypothetical protein
VSRKDKASLSGDAPDTGVDDEDGNREDDDDDDAATAEDDDEDDDDEEEEEEEEEEEGVADDAVVAVEKERNSNDAASGVCTRSVIASHVISSDSNSKYAHESACSAALLSAGTLNVVLGGKLRTRRERRARKSAKYPAAYSSSMIDSLEETQAKKMAAK